MYHNQRSASAKASELLYSVSAYLGMAYGKVEDPSSGTAYFQFTNMLFVGAASLSKVNLRTQARTRISA